MPREQPLRAGRRASRLFGLRRLGRLDAAIAVVKGLDLIVVVGLSRHRRGNGLSEKHQTEECVECVATLRRRRERGDRRTMHVR